MGLAVLLISGYVHLTVLIFLTKLSHSLNFFLQGYESFDSNLMVSECLRT